MNPLVGIPTVYRGVQYRSRLEARWACMFDLLGWTYQYDPFDLEGWIPDFLIRGLCDVLVEVKPATKFPEEVAAEIDRSSWEGEALIVGCMLVREGVYGDDDCRFGWSGEVHPVPQELVPGRFWADLFYGKAGDKIGYCNEQACWSDRVFPHDYERGNEGLGNDLGPIVEPLWHRAGNLVQWRGKQSEVRS